MLEGLNTSIVRTGDNYSFHLKLHLKLYLQKTKMLVHNVQNYNKQSIIFKIHYFFYALWRQLIMQKIYNFINRDVVDLGPTKTNYDNDTVVLKQRCSIPMQNLHIEENRLATFNKWSSQVVSKEQLAMLGFYHIGPEDTVKCYFCKVEIGNWELGDNAYVEHKRWSANCALLNRSQTNNIPKDPIALNAILPPRSFDVCGNRTIEYRTDAFAESASTDIIEHTIMPQHSDFAIESERIKSYTNWPKAMKQKPKELSDAGFFYIGKGDAVKCFSCGGGLKDWEEDDLPWEQHALWYKKCRYLNLVKGSEYIERIQAQQNPQHQENEIEKEHTVSVQNIVSNEEENTSGELSQDDKLCKICYSTEFNTVFFPCGHIIACGKCASSLRNCPVCRKEITEVKRVYFS